MLAGGACTYPAALPLFRRIPAKSLVSWNTTVNTLAGNRDHLTALDLFRDMWRDMSLAPDAYTVQNVLSAHAGVGALSLRVYVHALAAATGALVVTAMARLCPANY